MSRRLSKLSHQANGTPNCSSKHTPSMHVAISVEPPPSFPQIMFNLAVGEAWQDLYLLWAPNWSLFLLMAIGLKLHLLSALFIQFRLNSFMVYQCDNKIKIVIQLTLIPELTWQIDAHIKPPEMFFAFCYPCRLLTLADKPAEECSCDRACTTVCVQRAPDSQSDTCLRRTQTKSQSKKH